MKSRIPFPTLALLAFSMVSIRAADLPNILWITSEDNGPELGCYGDTYAVSPHIDAIAKQGMLYLNAWSTAPVCAPARTTIISGVYPAATGSQHMRSSAPMPPHMRMYPQFLREKGYYCTNASKEDYNLEKPDGVWDESSKKAHWRNRKAGQPFFAIFNFTVSHESQIRKRSHTLKHDPAKAPVPAYHPDTPEVRHDWAQYYDKITEMDDMVGKTLRELKEDGLEEDTIIFYYGDHGSGMPRSKRWPYNSGLQVPMIVHFPAKWRHLAPREYQVGGKSDRLVGFIDLAPTLLSLIGEVPPDWMQGLAFAGKHQTAAPQYAFGFRGRMDERYDFVRTVRDQRYIYIRNYNPHRIYGQYIDYMFQTDTTRIWHDLYVAGNLKAPQTYFWEPKAPEELYDLNQDPDEVNNLAEQPAMRKTLERFRQVNRDHLLRIRDLGFLPEGEMHSRAGKDAPRTMGLDNRRYPMRHIMETAEMAARRDPGSVDALRRAFGDQDSAVRYWAAMGMLIRGESAVSQARAELRWALKDESPYVRAVSAEALGRYGNADDLETALEVLMQLASVEENGIYVSMAALNAIDYLDEKAAPAKAALAKLPTQDKNADRRMGAYVRNLLKKILADLD